MQIQSRIATVFANLVVKRPGMVALVTLVLALASAVTARRVLHINTNQLDLISQDLRQVKDVKRVVDMIGGTGHLIIGLRGADEQTLKDVADDLAHQLEADKENVRTLTYKISAEFVREHAALFMKTDDLGELHKRSMEFLRDKAKRASPFFMEIVPTAPVELKYQDIVDKYTHIGKKSILDDIYISNDRQMVLLLVKPMWSTTELDKTGKFLTELRERFAAYGKTGAHGLKGLKEDYEGKPDQDGKVVQFGFTGSYPSTYDDSYNIEQSLAPVSIYAFVGVVIVLLLFFRRRFGSVAFVLSGLVLGIAVAFGFAAVSIGELNMITSILGGILLGTGIDFGIFFVYRLREELGRQPTPAEAVRQTIIHAGPASFIAALGTGGAFLTLLVSDFRGFSQFGLLAGIGVFLIALTIYLWVPSVFLLAERRFPGLASKLVGGADAKALAEAADDQRPIPRPKLVLAGALLVVLAVAAFASKVVFDYDSRALVVEHQPTIMLQDEINARFQISSDPVAVYTPTIEAAKQVFDSLKPGDPAHDTIDQVVSMYTFVPPKEQQEANAKILAEWKGELADIDPQVLPAEYRGKWAEALKYLDAKPYELQDVPQHYRDMFTNLPSTQPENRGYLTFIYPKVDLWDGAQMLHFASQVEDLPTKDGQVYHSAGVTILMATLAKIVLHDSRVFVILTFIMLLVVLIIDTRSIRNALIALVPLVLGMGVMLGSLALFKMHLNFMNIVVFPILLGFGVSQGVYLIHRFEEGTSPRAALKSVGTAVACSTLTALVGWAALLAAAHKGLKTMGTVACVGMMATLLVSFTVMPAVLQLLHDRRKKQAAGAQAAEETKPEVGLAP